MPPRRSHKKSRAGCRRCKSRKIKCDEVHPRCGHCVKHGVACDFEDSEPSPVANSAAPDTPGLIPRTAANSPRLPSPVRSSPNRALIPSSPRLLKAPSAPSMSATTPAEARLLELRLMHHYTALTCKTFTFTAPLTEELWKTAVPQVALAGAQHLTDAVLAVAALHLRTLCPDDKELVRASHAYMAASLSQYSTTLNRGIEASNAEALFLTSTLIVTQSMATRALAQHGAAYDDIPLTLFYSFQGVKAITAASWRFLRTSPVATQIINSQVVLQLDFSFDAGSFFGHLLEGLDTELDALAESHRESLVNSTRQAYQHAVAVLNWAHKIPHRGAPLAFPATVSRRFVELLEEKQPRAIAILACFLALLRSLDGVWWLHGLARREVLGIVSLFRDGHFGPNVYDTWLPHLDWALRIAAWDDGDGPIPPDVWGADWVAEERKLAQDDAGDSSYVKHIDMMSDLAAPVPRIPEAPHSNTP